MYQRKDLRDRSYISIFLCYNRAMDITFTTRFGTITLNDERDEKMRASFEKDGHQNEDINILLPYARDGIVVDVGAHIGTISIPLASVAKKVYAFEPVTESARYLRKNIMDNHLTNIEVHELAVGAHEGHVSMVANNVHNHAGTQVLGEGDIPMRSLDSFHLTPTLIKIDTDGFEPEVLEGAADTIATYKPVVFFEFFMPQIRAKKNVLARIEKSLKGYCFYCDGKEYSRLWHIPLMTETKSFLLRKGGLVRNVLALPRK